MAIALVKLTQASEKVKITTDMETELETLKEEQTRKEEELAKVDTQLAATEEAIAKEKTAYEAKEAANTAANEALVA